MAKVYDEEPASGFVRPDDILKTDRFTDFSTVSNRGYSQLTRAKRHGRWWMLKGLKVQYRQDAVYRALLQKEYEITSQLQHPMVVSAFSLEELLYLFLGKKTSAAVTAEFAVISSVFQGTVAVRTLTLPHFRHPSLPWFLYFPLLPVQLPLPVLHLPQM